MEEVRTYSTAQKSTKCERRFIAQGRPLEKEREWEEEAMTAVAKVNGGGGRR